jgi:hypothetical protein
LFSFLLSLVESNRPSKPAKKMATHIRVDSGIFVRKNTQGAAIFTGCGNIAMFRIHRLILVA